MKVTANLGLALRFILGVARAEWTSVDQPPSVGPGGWEGYCGQTAICNLAAMEGIFIPPEQLFWPCYDWTPGTHPETFVDCINSINNVGEWEICHPDVSAGANPILWLHSQIHGVGGHPVAVLITTPDGQLHWVTVVEVKDPGTPACTVVFLQYGREDTMSCAAFEDAWSLDETILGSIVQGADVIDGYTAICQVSPPDILVDQPPQAPNPDYVTVGCFPGDEPHDVWQRCRDALKDWVVQEGYIWDTSCEDIWADDSIGADDWRWQACNNLVQQCIAQTNAVCVVNTGAAGCAGCRRRAREMTVSSDPDSDYCPPPPESTTTAYTSSTYPSTTEGSSTSYTSSTFPSTTEGSSTSYTTYYP